MTVVWPAAAIILLLTVAAGLIRVLRGPTAAERMLAAQLFGTSGVALLLLLDQQAGPGELTDVALVFALLAAVAVVAFVRQRNLPPELNEEPEDD